jgi:hypothetical protein
LADTILRPFQRLSPAAGTCVASYIMLLVEDDLDAIAVKIKDSRVKAGTVGESMRRRAVWGSTSV